MGYKLSSEKIKPTKDKTNMFQALRDPTTVREVRQILGVINRYGKFIPRLAIIAQPIHDLLKKNKQWKWDRIHVEAFMNIKEALLKREALAPFETNSDMLVTLSCDGSEEGGGRCSGIRTS